MHGLFKARVKIKLKTKYKSKKEMKTKSEIIKIQNTQKLNVYISITIQLVAVIIQIIDFIN